jgi:hypothetical protein
MRKFKEGDKVKVIGRNATLNRKIKYGDVRTVTNTMSDSVQLDGIDDGWLEDISVELAEDTSKPVYTQEMYDKGELPAVGMYFNCSDEVNYDTRIDDFKGKEVEVIAVSDFFGKKVITFYHSTKGLGCGNFLKSWVHPITPAPIELIDGNSYMFDYHKNWKEIVGVYSQRGESFLTGMGILRPWNVTNIRPIELIDEAAYMFDYEGVSCTGVYEAVTERFYFTRGRHILASHCTNIRPMTVTESK